jgi:RHS repeat-associated protein
MPYVAPSATALKMSITGGNQQTGLVYAQLPPGATGLLLPAPLQVLITDTQGTPQPGVRVSFIASTGAPITFEEDPNGGSTTTVSGYASVLVRTASGAPGPVTVTAQVVGAPSVQQPFNLTLYAPQIVPTAFPQLAQYGEYWQLYLVFGGNGAPNNNSVFAPELCRPVRLKVSATNVTVSTNEVVLTTNNVISFYAAITVLDHPAAPLQANIVITDTLNPQITATVNFPIQTTDGSSRILGGGPNAQVENVRISIQPISPAPGTPSLVAYPGLTLATPFNFKVTDDSNLNYTECVTNDPNVCGTPPTTAPLQLTYSGQGLFLPGSAAAPGTQNSLAVNIGTPVFFQPKGQGPWQITVSTTTANIADPLRREYPWVDANGQQQCTVQNQVGGVYSYNFPVLTPNVAFVDSSNPPATVDKLIPGNQVTLQFTGISPSAGGAPEAVTVNLVAANDSTQVPNYTMNGAAIPFPQNQNIPVTLSGNDVQSAALTITRNPSSTSANPLLVIPHWHLTVQTCSGTLAWAVIGQSVSRKMIAGSESIQEPVAGTAARAGASDSVLVHNGEFVYCHDDLNFAVRGGSFHCRRTYRDHLLTEGPFGPGWIFEHAAFLDVSNTYTIRMCDPTGIFNDFPADGTWTPKGRFLKFAVHYNLDSNTSAFQITDAHKNVIHFNIDGSMRFTRDRFGNPVVQYSYNDAGQLSQIQDAHNRVVALDYWQLGDPVGKDTVGKLKSITDFTGRKITYTYYEGGDPKGGAGWLKSVTLPAALSSVNGTLQNYSRTETYQYSVNANNRLVGQFTSLLDTNGQQWLANQFDPQGRVKQQLRQLDASPGTGTYLFAYNIANLPPPSPPATFNTLVTDRMSYQRAYTFAESPWPDAAAPQTTTICGQSQSQIYSLNYNQDGNVVSLKLGAAGAGGATVSAAEDWQFVYDDPSTTPQVSHGNLRTVIQNSIGPKAQQRITTFAYNYDFNVVQRLAGPRANAPNVNSEVHATYYIHDAQGNLTKVDLPRTFNVVIGPDPAAPGQLKEFWIDENPGITLTYNAFGLITTRTDSRGVVTEYQYYPEKTPTSGVTDSTHGGLLAAVIYDTTDSAKRASHMPEVAPEVLFPLLKQRIICQYNELGDVTQIVDARGMTIVLQPDALHRLTEFVQDATGLGAAAPLAITTDFTYNELDFLVTRELKQPTANPQAQAGGPSLIDKWVYDSLGNLQSHTATLTQGQQVTESYSRDANGRLLSYKPFDVSAGRYPNADLNVGWNEHDQPTSMVDGKNSADPLSATLDWSATDQAQKLTDPGNNVDSWQQDAFGANYGQIDPLYNHYFNLTDLAGAGTREAVRHAPQAATQASTADPLGGQVETRLDELERVCRIHVTGLVANTPSTQAATGVQTQPLGSVPDYFPSDPSWPAASQVMALREGPWGKNDLRWTRDAAYDGLLMTRLIDDEKRCIYLRYGAGGQLVQIADPAGNTCTYSYNENNQVTDTSIFEQGTTVFTVSPESATYVSRQEIDAVGCITRKIDGEGNAWRFVYDETGYVQSITDANGPDSAEIYNGSTVNAAGNLTTCARDGLGRTLHVETKLCVNGIGGGAPDTNAYNQTGIIAFDVAYDEVGRMLSYKDMAGNSTTWQYEPDTGRYQSITWAPCQAAGNKVTQSSVTYDDAGRIETWTDANGTQLLYSYDGLDRVKKVSVQTAGIGGDPGYTFTYDGAALTTTDLVSNYSVLAISDSAGRPCWLIQGSRTVFSEFDGAGRRVALHYSDGTVVTYNHDQLGRLITVTDRGTVVANFEHLGHHGVLERIQPPLSTKLSYSPGTGRLQGATISGLTQGSIVFTLKHDRVGRITNLSRASTANEQKTWQYDSAGRIVLETSQPVGNPGSIVTTRLFDGDGVLREENSSTGGPTAQVWKQNREERGRIISRNNTNYIWDLNGNLINDGNQLYTYDAWNRLIRATGQSTVSYAYDGSGRLISRTWAGVTEQYVYDDRWNLIEVWTEDLVLQKYVLTERYVYGSGVDELLCVDINGKHYTYLLDPRGYVEAIVNDQHQIVERYDYTLTGQVTILDGSGVVKASTPISRFLFQCRPYDALTGLFNYRMRWYSPALGFFLTPDPMGFQEGSNLYILNQGDTINGADPLGMQDTSDTVKNFLDAFTDPDTWRDVDKHAWDHFWGAAYGASKNVAGGLKLVFVDQWAQSFSETSRSNMEEAQDYLADFFHRVHEAGPKGAPKAVVNWVNEGIDQRMHAMLRAELEGRPFDAATVFGDSAMNIYFAAKAFISMTRGVGAAVRAVRSNGVRGALGQAMNGARSWLKPSPRLKQLFKPRSPSRTSRIAPQPSSPMGVVRRACEAQQVQRAAAMARGRCRTGGYRTVVRLFDLQGNQLAETSVRSGQAGALEAVGRRLPGQPHAEHVAMAWTERWAAENPGRAAAVRRVTITPADPSVVKDPCGLSLLDPEGAGRPGCADFLRRASHRMDLVIEYEGPGYNLRFAPWDYLYYHTGHVLH